MLRSFPSCRNARRLEHQKRIYPQRQGLNCRRLHETHAAKLIPQQDAQNKYTPPKVSLELRPVVVGLALSYWHHYQQAACKQLLEVSKGKRPKLPVEGPTRKLPALVVRSNRQAYRTWREAMVVLRIDRRLRSIPVEVMFVCASAQHETKRRPSAKKGAPCVYNPSKLFSTADPWSIRSDYPIGLLYHRQW